MAKQSEERPLYLEDEIIRYLEEQQRQVILTEYGTSDDQRHRQAEVTVRQILEEILHKVELVPLIKEIYEKKVREHNQYALFDFRKIVPDFYIDDKTYEALTFRETLVISTFDDENNLYQVGGLCVDVQKAKGSKPFQRLRPGFEQRIIERITAKLQNMELASASSSEGSLKTSTVTDSPENRAFLNELREYEEYLKHEMRQEFCKFLVHVSSQLTFMGNNGGSRITTWVDRNLHTLEEKRREYIMQNDELNEKTLYTALQEKKYFVKHTSTEEKLKTRKYYSFRKAQNYISEGSNFVLMRYLALKRFIGTFELSTMYINGDMCRNIYDCKGPESGVINGQKLDLCKIYRVILEECGIKHKCCTILTLSGQIVRQEWKWCDYILYINPAAFITNEKPKGNEHLLLHKVWKNDMQMYSEYLDQKKVNFLKIKSYLLDHPELKNLLADYVQLILQMKPENILDFSIEYFQTFCSRDVPRLEYFEGDEIENEPFRL